MRSADLPYTYIEATAQPAEKPGMGIEVCLYGRTTFVSCAGADQLMHALRDALRGCQETEQL
jgi:hypothetical protein